MLWGIGQRVSDNNLGRVWRCWKHVQSQDRNEHSQSWMCPGNTEWGHPKLGRQQRTGTLKENSHRKDCRSEALCEMSALSCPTTFVQFHNGKKCFAGIVNIIFKDRESLSRWCYVLCKVRIHETGMAHFMSWISSLFLSYLVWSIHLVQNNWKKAKLGA